VKGEGQSGRGRPGSGLWIWVAPALLFLSAFPGVGAPVDALFREGVSSYRAGDYSLSATAFRQAAALQPASGTLQNLGIAEWQRGRVGAAVLAWEQALWLDPFNGAAREDLRFARKAAQINTPELVWYEVVSTWLPTNWWAWIAGISFWVAVGAGMLPGIFRLRKAGWQQGIAAIALMVFLLSLPAHVGVHTRCRIGFVLQKSTPLRLTPTQESQSLTRMAAGEPARWERIHGNYVLVRTSPEGLRGWVEREQFGLISP
jgi:hypothetical protein